MRAGRRFGLGMRIVKVAHTHVPLKRSATGAQPRRGATLVKKSVLLRMRWPSPRAGFVASIDIQPSGLKSTYDRLDTPAADWPFTAQFSPFPKRFPI